jgi:beta-lactamase superfamily II metal-dependent hydrolase
MGSEAGARFSPSSGRWFYALAIGGGLFWYPCFRSIHVGLAVGSWLGVVLWEVGKTGSISLATPLLSLITLPVVCVWIYPFTLVSLILNTLGMIDLSQTLLSTSATVLNFVTLKLASWVMYPGNLWIIPKWSLVFGLVLSFFVVGFNLTFKQNRKSLFLLIGIVLLVRITKEHSTHFGKHTEEATTAQLIHQLDVGQGDSALVIGSQIGLIDTGSFYSLSDSAWLELFTERQIQDIHWVGLTHLDEDHIGGLLRLARLIPIGCVSTPRAGVETEKGKRFVKQLHPLHLRLQDWTSPCIPFPTFAPSPVIPPHKKRKASRANENMGALFIPLQSGGYYVSAGDASQKDEILIGKWVTQVSKAAKSKNHPHIVKINHHGSKTSSSSIYLKAIQPTEAWISVGRNNRYGHPSLQVLKELEKQGIRVRRTDNEGILSISAPTTTH